MPATDHYLIVLWAALDDLKTIKCRECDGYGHHRKECPTYKKIQGVTKNIGPMKSMINRAREKEIHDRLPTILGRRRVRVYNNRLA